MTPVTDNDPRPAPLTPEALANWRLWHTNTENKYACDEDREAWPCRTSQVLATLDAERGYLRDATRRYENAENNMLLAAKELVAERAGAGRLCPICRAKVVHEAECPSTPTGRWLYHGGPMPEPPHESRPVHVKQHDRDDTREDRIAVDRPLDAEPGQPT